jgi:hypothetical protein
LIHSIFHTVLTRSYFVKMQLLCASSLFLLATSVSAKAWNVNIYSDSNCKNYISSWHDTANPWTFGYSYGIHCAKVTNGPDDGWCQFWADDNCSEDIGNDSRVSPGGQVTTQGYVEIKCWTCKTNS